MQDCEGKTKAYGGRECDTSTVLLGSESLYRELSGDIFAEAGDYEVLYQNIVKKFQNTFFDVEGNLTSQTQTAHIVALYFKLVPEEYVSKITERLKRLLEKENGHLVTGFVGTPYFCHALSQNGCVKKRMNYY